MIMNAMERALYDRLQVEREVHFRYRKENGELRDACGTCNLDFIPRHKWPAKHLPITTSIRYYDWKRDDWRSFSLGSLIEVLPRKNEECMTEEEKAKCEKAFQELLKGIEVVTTDEHDLFYNVPGSSKYKYRRGAWRDYYKAVLDAQDIKGVDYNECRRKRCDGKKTEEIFGVHLYRLGDVETTDNIWIALACQTSNNGSEDEIFELKKGTIIVKFTTNELVTRIEKDM